MFLWWFKALWYIWYIGAPQGDCIGWHCARTMWTCQLKDFCEWRSLIVLGMDVPLAIVTRSAFGVLVWTELIQRAHAPCHFLMSWLASYLKTYNFYKKCWCTPRYMLLLAIKDKWLDRAGVSAWAERSSKGGSRVVLFDLVKVRRSS